MRILIVEDEIDLAQTLARCLSEEGYVTDIADNGEDGLILAESDRYDLIILDLMLPRLDGMEIIRRLRDRRIKTAVLMLTARDTLTDLKPSRRKTTNGGYCWLRKGANPMPGLRLSVLGKKSNGRCIVCWYYFS